jgi:nickel superoxide dismutase
MEPRSRDRRNPKDDHMTLLDRSLRLLDLLHAPRVAHAHCDLPCGVYDPAQARIEAQSVKACMEKYLASDDVDFKVRATTIKEERADLVKEHLWVLWTDYFKPEHLKAHPNLHELFWKATKTAGEAKKTNDVAVGDRLLTEIDEIAEVFWETKK